MGRIVVECDECTYPFPEKFKKVVWKALQKKQKISDMRHHNIIIVHVDNAWEAIQPSVYMYIAIHVHVCTSIDTLW